MRRESLKGLEFKNVTEISDFCEKLAEFLNDLDEELETWRDYVEKNGKRSIPHRITGYACLDREKIVGIYYFSLSKKFSVRYSIQRLFLPREAQIGILVKKEYQRRGIATHLRELTRDLLRELGYKREVSSVDSDNIAGLKYANKGGSRIEKRDDEEIHFVYNLIDDDHNQKHSNQ